MRGRFARCDNGLLQLVLEPESREERLLAGFFADQLVDKANEGRLHGREYDACYGGLLNLNFGPAPRAREDGKGER